MTNPVWLPEHIREVIARHKIDEEIKLLKIKASRGKLKKKFKKQLKQLKIKHKKEIKQELRKLDRFYKIMATTDKTYRQVEADVYHNENFYIEYERKKAEEEEERKPVKHRSKRAKKIKKRRKPILKEPKQNLYLEKDLSSKSLDSLLNWKFKRMKISPFGDTGAAYYWIKTRYNEGKEHAFFCYLIESEVKKHIRKVKLNVNNGSDVEFEYKKKKYCFDVETGKKLERSKVSVDWKYSKYKREYDYIFVLVTRKSLKYKYNRYGTVITRAKLKDTINSIFTTGSCG